MDCAVQDCNKAVKHRGFCNAHYLRLKRHGNPLGGAASRGHVQQYFSDVVMQYEGTECRPWPFGRNRAGYGMISHDGQMRLVHRRVCEETRGPPPTPAHEAAHSCGKGHLACCTKAHLDWKTPKDNIADQLIHGTRNRGNRNASAKLTESDVISIRSAAKNESHKAIADRYNVCRQSVDDIVSGRNWGWLWAQ